MNTEEFDPQLVYEVVTQIEAALMRLRDYATNRNTEYPHQLAEFPIPVNIDIKNQKQWIFNTNDIAVLFDVSERTIRCYRDEGFLSYSQLKDKIWYTKKDIEDFMVRCHVEYFTEQNRIGD